MTTEQELQELLDRYNRGSLNESEARALHERMNADAEFKSKVEAYLELMRVVKQHGDRQTLRKVLDEIHQQLATPDDIKVIPLTRDELPGSWWKKYRSLVGVAASVAFISIAGTLLITQSLKLKHTADYKELYRKVDQLKESQKRILADISESKENTVVLAPGKYLGTGFMISNQGYVATSYHLIKDSDSVCVENKTWGRLKASIVYSDPANDISILKIDNADDRIGRPLPYTLAGHESNLGEAVFTLGFPRDEIVYGEGSISASSGYRENPNAYQISVPVNPGNSGGPLLNSKGNVVGMISGLQTETLGAAFAIKSSVILDEIHTGIIDSLKIPIRIPKQNSLVGLSRVEQIKRCKEFIFMIRVYNN